MPPSPNEKKKHLRLLFARVISYILGAVFIINFTSQLLLPGLFLEKGTWRTTTPEQIQKCKSWCFWSLILKTPSFDEPKLWKYSLAWGYMALHTGLRHRISVHIHHRYNHCTMHMFTYNTYVSYNFTNDCYAISIVRCFLSTAGNWRKKETKNENVTEEGIGKWRQSESFSKDAILNTSYYLWTWIINKI